MLLLSLRVLLAAMLFVTVATAAASSWWPERLLPRRSGGTLDRPPDDPQSLHPLIPKSASIGWLSLITVMALLMGVWILMVVLT